MADGLVIGIDLGTTFSAVAYIDKHGKPMVIPNREGDPTTPSVIFFEDDGTPVVGREARNQAITSPLRTVRFIKLEMGNPSYRKNIDGTDYLPEQLSAFILKKLKADAETQLGISIAHAVISVPAYFKDSQREATRQAAQIAGLEVVRIINEPTAAALAYGVDKALDDQNIVVYDFGGGTFDVTVMNVKASNFRILATDGDAKLGGKNIDERIVDFLANEFQREHALDLRVDVHTHQDLWDRAEQAKKDLSFRDNVAVVLQSGANVLRVDLDREILNELIKDLIEETRKRMENALAATGLTWSDIDVILLAGGSSRIPAVREMIKRTAGKDAAKDMNPDQCVAMGAAIQAMVAVNEVEGIAPSTSEKSGDSTAIVVQDVAAHSLGVKALGPDKKGYLNSIIVPRFTPVPCERTRVYATNEDNQKKIEVEVLQGEDSDPMSPAVDLIGKFSIGDLPPHKAGDLRVLVTLRYDMDGVIEVTAKELLSGKTTRERMMRKTGLLSAEHVNELTEAISKVEI